MSLQHRIARCGKGGITVLLDHNRDRAPDCGTPDSDDVHYELNSISSGGHGSDFSYGGNDTFATSPTQAQGPQVTYINMSLRFHSYLPLCS